MKLNTMKPAELVALADEFAVELEQGLNKQQILARYVEDGVTQTMVDQYFAAREKAEADAALEAEAAEVRRVNEEQFALEQEAERELAEAEAARAALNRRNVVSTTNIVNESLVEAPLTTADLVVAEAEKRTALQRASKTQVLMVMDRENRSYQVRGYKFTQEHPFVLVAPDDAEFIAEQIDGFRYATPKEAREYYS